MNATTAAIDLAKNVFQVALADANARCSSSNRFTRAQFERPARCGWVRAPRASMPCAGFAANWGCMYPWVRAPAWKPWDAPSPMIAR